MKVLIRVFIGRMSFAIASLILYSSFHLILTDCKASDFSRKDRQNEIIPITLSSDVQFSYLLIQKKCFPIFNKDGVKKCTSVIEYPLPWPSGNIADTHEFTYNSKGGKVFWVTGDTHDAIARVQLNGKSKFFAMPEGSIPHGVVFDRKNNLWVTLQGLGFIVRVNKYGEIVEWVDIHFKVPGTNEIINPRPHGLCLSSDGKALWFTGREGNTVGTIFLKDRSVKQFELPTPNSFPIYISPGPNDTIWCTELLGNNIVRITKEGQITEFAIPTPNSRPIGIVESPNKDVMWFSEESGHNVASITLEGNIIEYPVPKIQQNMLLASLTFDKKGNLWTQSYVSRENPIPEGFDYIIKIDRDIQYVSLRVDFLVPITYYQVPSTQTVFHRIRQGPDKNIWFTELALDGIGKVFTKHSCSNNSRKQKDLLKEKKQRQDLLQES